MKKPITLYIPEYYNRKIEDNYALKISKSAQLYNKDDSKALFLASIENPKKYECKLKEIPENYLQIATNCFNRDRAENWELPMTIDGCKTYTYYWDDEYCHFRIYWIIISEKHMLQLAGIFDPAHSVFYKQHFMTYFHSTKIERDFDFSTEKNPENLFDVIKVPVEVSPLEKLMKQRKKVDEKSKYLEENLKVSNPNFYKILETELLEKEDVTIEAFMCLDWNMYYDLGNPENFSHPDSNVEWEDNSDVFQYFEKPYTDNTKVSIIRCEDDFDSRLLKNLVENNEQIAQSILSFLEHYTFGNGGAYTEAIHYEYAKIEIERLHNTSYTHQGFLKRNVCLKEIEVLKSSNECRLQFACSWDTEHGIAIIINDKFECRVE